MFPPHSLLGVVTYLRHQIVLLYPFCLVVYNNSTLIMSQIEPIIWYVLHTKWMAEVTTWSFYLFSGVESGFCWTLSFHGMLVRTIHH